ncbi:hypothetical protein SAMN05216598_5046 [Pseudomonas asplenii]|uniref:Integrase catalytic domain-containing protein n=1 Tax=Pseudomonas asplenii TaxID=53407 RepID=A0A1H1ZFP8_9PSED|nr:hypothetical protein SAMN05216598_5046 [Pseudomonas asplenii]
MRHLLIIERAEHSLLLFTGNGPQRLGLVDARRGQPHTAFHLGHQAFAAQVSFRVVIDSTVWRLRASGVDRRDQIPEMVSIHVRPPEIEDRVMPGPWEGDLFKGKANSSCVGMLVERTSGYLMLIKMNDTTVTSAVEGLGVALNGMPLVMRKSMTYQSREMPRHAEITQKTGVAIFFCDPHSPWQRGSHENINGLIRQYLPRGTDLSVYSQVELDAIALRLNMRPRKRFDFKCPIEMMSEVMHKTVGMRHDTPASIQ